jgi:hypothetical protein
MDRWLPKIEALDMIKVEGKIPIQKDYKQVYKIDSYCLGASIIFFKIYIRKTPYMCVLIEKKQTV